MQSTIETTIQKLLEIDRAWAEAARGNDIDRICAFWSDDAVLYNVAGSGMQIEGLDSIRAFVSKVRAIPGRSISWIPNDAFVSASADVGATRGTFEVAAPGEDGRLITRHGTYFNVWKKNADGAWKCAFETHLL